MACWITLLKQNGSRIRLEAGHSPIGNKKGLRVLFASPDSLQMGGIAKVQCGVYSGFESCDFSCLDLDSYGEFYGAAHPYI